MYTTKYIKNIEMFCDFRNRFEIVKKAMLIDVSHLQLT